MASAESPIRLLIVDDEPMVRELLCAFLEDHGFVCQASASVDEALFHLEQSQADLVISDLHMPGRNGLDLLEAIGSKHPRTAFLMATAAPDTETAVQAMRNGAADFLVKPLDLQQVLAAVRATVARRRQAEAVAARQKEAEALLAERTQQLGLALQQLQAASNETLRAVAMTLDVRAHDVAGHCLRVSRYALEMAALLGYDTAELERLEHASYLHDIGKLGIPDAILNKPAALDPEEQHIMRGHVQIGFDMVTQVPSLAHAADLVLAHQEHFDGSGYPRGLKGDAIPLDARIFAVADTLDAMTSDRPYRRALSWSEASTEILDQSGKQFDPGVVAAFTKISLERWRQLQVGPAEMPAARRQ